MAKGEFIWFLGDDDLTVNNSVKYLTNLIKKKKKYRFFLDKLLLSQYLTLTKIF